MPAWASGAPGPNTAPGRSSNDGGLDGAPQSCTSILVGTTALSCGATTTVGDRSVSTVVLGLRSVVTESGTSPLLRTVRRRSTTDEPAEPVTSPPTTDTVVGRSAARQASRTAMSSAVVEESKGCSRSGPAPASDSGRTSRP